MATRSPLSILSSRGYFAAVGGSALGAALAVGLAAAIGAVLGDPHAGIGNIALMLVVGLTLGVGAVLAMPLGCYWTLLRSGHKAAGSTALLLFAVVATSLVVVIDALIVLLVFPFIVVGSALIARALALFIHERRDSRVARS